MLESPSPSPSASAYHVEGVHEAVPVNTILSRSRYLFFATTNVNVMVVVDDPSFGVNEEPDKEPLDILSVGAAVPPEPSVM